MDLECNHLITLIRSVGFVGCQVKGYYSYKLGSDIYLDIYMGDCLRIYPCCNINNTIALDYIPEIHTDEWVIKWLEDSIFELRLSEVG